MAIGMEETHDSADKFKGLNLKASIEAWGRRVFPAHAAPSNKALGGTSGGVLVAPALGLQLAPMSLKENGNVNCKGEDWSAVVIRAQGVSYVFLCAYFIHTIGPVGPNLKRLTAIATFLINTGLPFIVAADWNMVPKQLLGSGFLDLVSGDIRACENVEYTCNSGRNIDYIVVKRSFSSAVRSVRTSSITPWEAHKGLEIEVSERPLKTHDVCMVEPVSMVDELSVMKTKDERPALDTVGDVNVEYKCVQ